MDQQLLRQDGQLTRLSTDNGFLICSFSQTRFRKDKHEMDKQIARANGLIQQPSKNRKTKFVKAQQQKLELNQELIAKTTKLSGVKGYYPANQTRSAALKRTSQESINNRGYNKYLKPDGEVEVAIDYEKYKTDSKWDGLKGYLTNTTLPAGQVIENYKNLWKIKKLLEPISKILLRVSVIPSRSIGIIRNPQLDALNWGLRVVAPACA